jgi:hypothetical protein
MSTDCSDQRTRFYNRIVKMGLIGSAVAFGSLIVVLVVPVDRTIGLVAAGAAVLLMTASAFAMVVAIAARDISTWKRNRWRYSISSLFNLMYAVAVMLGSIVAIERDVGLTRIALAWGGLLLVSVVVNAAYITWARNRYFNAMNAQDRFLDWSAIADAVGRGEGTLLVGKCHHVPTVWWSERKISAADDAKTAIESDAMLTTCPQRKHISNWLKKNYPDVPVIETDAASKSVF